MELDQNLASLIQQAQEVLATQNRLRELLRVNRTVVGELDLDNVLRRIVEAACELVDADYGALGVIGPEGQGLERFVHVGLDARLVPQIGHLPEGKGLLGLIIEDPRPLRLRDLQEHPRAAGFPAHHPPMHGFIGVPIRIRGEVFGNLYLTRREGKEFTAEDEELVVSVAATAATAIENARLFHEARRRQDWLTTSAEVTRQLLSNATESPLRLIARNVHRLGDADLVAVVQPGPDGRTIVVAEAFGEQEEAVAAQTYPLENTLTELVLTTGQTVRLVDAEDTRDYGDRTVFLAQKVPIGPAMLVPLLGTNGVRGLLWVARTKHRRRFTGSDEEMVATFANQASIAWELADARQARQAMELAEDRARIARDLHDHVIQRLFAAGLSLQATVPQAGAAGQMLEKVIDDLDDVIKQIRSSIFQLRPTNGGIRGAILDVVTEVRSTLGFQPNVVFDGLVDNLPADDLLNDLTAVLRETLTNAAKHSGASAVEVLVDARGGDVRLVVTDNGRGLGAPTRSSGLANLRARAEARGGELSVKPGPEGAGASVSWCVPVRGSAL